MSWQRPNIGSRVNQEVHAQFWERPGVKLFRATRHKQSFHEILAMIRKDQVARIPANDIKTQRILIASLFAIAV